MALFTPIRLSREAKTVPYIGKTNPKDAKEKAKKLADLEATKEAKEVKIKEEKALKELKNKEEKSLNEVEKEEY